MYPVTYLFFWLYRMYFPTAHRLRLSSQRPSLLTERHSILDPSNLEDSDRDFKIELQ